LSQTAFGGLKQSGLGREGGREGLLRSLETETETETETTVVLDGAPQGFDT
jgi:acyl-CoA reductase-like NAD-dependent aldehyde dehydrogenase